MPYILGFDAIHQMEENYYCRFIQKSQKDSLEQIYLSRMRSLEGKKHVSGATTSIFFFKYYRQMMI